MLRVWLQWTYIFDFVLDSVILKSTLLWTPNILMCSRHSYIRTQTMYLQPYFTLRSDMKVPSETICSNSFWYGKYVHLNHDWMCLFPGQWRKKNHNFLSQGVFTIIMTPLILLPLASSSPLSLWLCTFSTRDILLISIELMARNRVATSMS